MNTKDIDTNLPLRIWKTGQEATYIGHVDDGRVIVKLNSSATECVICEYGDLENVVHTTNMTLSIPIRLGTLDIACTDKGVMAIGSGPAVMLMCNGSHKKLFSAMRELGNSSLREIGNDAEKTPNVQLNRTLMVDGTKVCITRYIDDAGGTDSTDSANGDPFLRIQFGLFFLFVRKQEYAPFITALDQVDAMYDQLNIVSGDGLLKRPHV